MLGLSLFASAAPAPAADPPAHYQVEVCTFNSPEAVDVQSVFVEELNEDGTPTGRGHGPIFFSACGDIASTLHQGTPGGDVPDDAGHVWALVAPTGTIIHTMEADQSFSHGSGQVSFLDWTLAAGNGTRLFTVHDDGRFEGALPPPSHQVYTVDSSFVASRLLCPHFLSGSCPGGAFNVFLSNVVVDLEDLEAPRLSEPGVAGGPVRGTTEVGYSASAGPGIASATLIVDGKPQKSVPDSNGGKCQQPYKSFTPCRGFVSSALPLDTQGLTEGQHEVAVEVVDAAGLSTKSAVVPITVRNAPTATVRPLISGDAELGARLTASTGAWAGSPTGFVYQWYQCPASARAVEDAGSCGAVPGAVSQEYAPTGADIGQRVLVEVTATNAKGSGSVISQPSELIKAPPPPTPPKDHKPVLSHVSLSHKRFRLARGSTKGGKTILRFACSKAGRLTIVIKRVTRRGKRPKRAGVLAAAIKAGPSAVLLNGEIGNKRLTPGRYQVTITVRDAAGNVSDPATLPFTIIRG